MTLSNQHVLISIYRSRLTAPRWPLTSSPSAPESPIPPPVPGSPWFWHKIKRKVHLRQLIKTSVHYYRVLKEASRTNKLKRLPFLLQNQCLHAFPQHLQDPAEQTLVLKVSQWLYSSLNLPNFSFNVTVQNKELTFFPGCPGGPFPPGGPRSPLSVGKRNQKLSMSVSGSRNNATRTCLYQRLSQQHFTISPRMPKPPHEPFCPDNPCKESKRAI